MFGALLPVTNSFPPPPRKGFAIRDPAPPKLKPELEGLEVEETLRVETLAASRRSLTAVSWASNLWAIFVSYLPVPKEWMRTAYL